MLDEDNGTLPGSSAKKRIVRRTRPTGDDADSAAAHHVDPAAAMQVVNSPAEADALVRRLKQLQVENSSLANSLAKVCDENSNLTGVVSRLEKKVSELAEAPLSQTSVLHSLFEPEKTGWFGGSKTAARDQLEKLADALQTEFMEYKASHASSNDEVQAILDAMQAANVNAADVAQLVTQLQESTTSGPAAIQVRILPIAEGADGVTVDELREEIRRHQNQADELRAEMRRTNEDLRVKCNEVIKLSNDLKEAREDARSTNGGAAAAQTGASWRLEVEAQKAKEENERLRVELQQLRQSLATEERLHSIKKLESEDLNKKLEALRASRKDEIADLQMKLEQSLEASASGCSRCEELKAELEHAKEEARAAQRATQALKSDLVKQSATMDTTAAANQGKLLEVQSRLSEVESQLRRSVPQADHASLEAERNTLAHELQLAKDRIATLEEINASHAKVRDDDRAPSLSDSVVLDTLERNKAQISRAEFERDQLREQLQQAQTYAVARDQEAQRLERSATEDKQRVAFLLKKCAGVAADLKTVTAARDALSEDVERHKVEVKQLQRQVEGTSGLQKKYDEVVKEKTHLEARLGSTAELEERLVSAKETIAYMELAQSSSINMSQYAELQAEKEKLVNTMGPLKKKLEDANKEIERLKSVTDAQQLVTGTQLSSVQNMQDQLDAATASEAKLRDKVAALSTENERLQKVNDSLETQMADMQDGIKEMAVQMDKERTTASVKATANSQKQVDELSAELVKVRAELANVQATNGQFVAEGLYTNACTERDRLADENRRRGFEFEKMKSEILIYRQTIADLEAENDEHVKEIESLQDRYKTERASLSERFKAEQARAEELASTVEGLKAELKETSTKLELSAASVRDLQDMSSKQKRAFEEKCTAEANLAAQLKTLQESHAALQENNVTLQSTYEQKLAEARSQSAVPPAPMAAAAVPPLPVLTSTISSPAGGDAATEAAALKNRAYQLQCDNDRLYGELKRVQLKHKAESDDDQRTIQQLQVQLKNRLPVDARAAYDAEVSRNAALKNSNAALLKEKEALERRVAAASAGTTTLAVASSSPSRALPSNAEDLQAQVLQLQQQITMQKSGFDAAMTQAIADAQGKQRRIEELEAELVSAQQQHVSENPTKNNSIAGRADGDGDQDDNESAQDGGVSPRPKKKVKKVRKKKTLAEQVAAADPTAAGLLAPAAAGSSGSLATTADILGAHAHVNGGGASGDPVKDLQLQLQLVQSDLVRAEKELEMLRKENTTLKETIGQLTEDLRNAQEDLDQANASMSEEREDFQRRIYALEKQVARSHNTPLVERTSSATLSGADSPSNRSFGRQQNAQETEMQLRSARDENEKLRGENKRLQNDLTKALRSGSDGPMSHAPTPQEVRKLHTLLKQKDAEIESLAEQLMPTKNKLAEYMAMADRLGVPYPFPPQLEGAMKVRMRAMHLDVPNRATSAPMAPAHGRGPGARMTAVTDGSPAPRPPPGARREVHRPPVGYGADRDRRGGGGGGTYADVDDLR